MDSTKEDEHLNLPDDRQPTPAAPEALAKEATDGCAL